MDKKIPAGNRPRPDLQPTKTPWFSPGPTQGNGVFSLDLGQGLTIIKTYSLSNDSYRIDLDIQVINNTAQPLDDNLALLLENRFPPLR